MSNKPKISTKEHLYDVFLCHNSSDKEVVEIIAKRLEDEANLRPFLDKWHLVPGKPWIEELEEALDASSTCAVFVGANGLSPWANEEMRTALNERAESKSLRIIPVLLPGSQPAKGGLLSRFLQRFTWVDFSQGLESSDAFHRLVSGIAGNAPGRTVPSQSHALPDEQKAVQWVIVLKGTVGDIGKAFIERSTSQLGEMSGDISLTIKKIKRGSIVLVVESSEQAFERIRSLFHEGKLEEVGGLSVLQVHPYAVTMSDGDKSFWNAVLEEIASRSNIDLSEIDTRDLAILLAESKSQEEQHEELLLTPRIVAEWPSEIVTEFVKWAHRHKSVRSGGRTISYLAEHILRCHEISRNLPTKKEGSGKSGAE